MKNTKKLKKNKLLPWFILILILLCFCVALIIFCILGNSYSCPPNVPCKECGEKFDDVPLEEKLNKITPSNPLIYGGFTTIAKIGMIQALASFTIIFDNPPTKKCSAELNNTIYTGNAKFCNLSDPSLKGTDPDTFKGWCQIFYTLIISKNPNNYFINFSFVYGECSQTITEKLGTITNLTYNPNNDTFTVNITTKEQNILGKKIPSEQIIIPLTNPAKTTPNLDPKNCIACDTKCCPDKSNCDAPNCFN